MGPGVGVMVAVGAGVDVGGGGVLDGTMGGTVGGTLVGAMVAWVAGGVVPHARPMITMSAASAKKGEMVLVFMAFLLLKNRVES
jgi:hypothetical protein